MMPRERRAKGRYQIIRILGNDNIKAIEESIRYYSPAEYWIISDTRELEEDGSEQSQEQLNEYEKTTDEIIVMLRKKDAICNTVRDYRYDYDAIVKMLSTIIAHITSKGDIPCIDVTGKNSTNIAACYTASEANKDVILFHSYATDFGLKDVVQIPKLIVDMPKEEDFLKLYLLINPGTDKRKNSDVIKKLIEYDLWYTDDKIRDPYGETSLPLEYLYEKKKKPGPKNDEMINLYNRLFSIKKTESILYKRNVIVKLQDKYGLIESHFEGRNVKYELTSKGKQYLQYFYPESAAKIKLEQRKRRIVDKLGINGKVQSETKKIGFRELPVYKIVEWYCSNCTWENDKLIKPKDIKLIKNKNDYEYTLRRKDTPDE